MKIANCKLQIEQWVKAALTGNQGGQTFDEDIRNHLAQVGDDDHCLAAVRELLGRHLLVNAATAGSLGSDDRTKLRACERMEFARMFLTELTERHQAAKQWRKQQEEQS